MKNYTFKYQYEKNNKYNQKKSFNTIKQENNSNYNSLNSSLSLPAIYRNNKTIKIKKPYKKEKFLEIKDYNKKDNIILKHKNFLTPVFKNSIKQINNIFFTRKDPRETIYNANNANKKLSNSLITNSYNIINKNNNEDHVKDLLNFGNRENLYNYIGKKGYNIYNPFPNFINKNFQKMIKEKISNDDSNEYYINNGWSVLEYAYKEEPNLNFRQSMEDKGKSVDGFNNNNDSGIFCIFDGHGGNEVSSFLQKNIVNYMREYSTNLDLLFQKMDLNFLNENFNQIGSTACIIYITKEYTINSTKKIFYCANIGDTRAVLINNSGIKRISYDDRATDKNESERVKKSKGVVFGGRIFGNLMLTRAFGDYEFKQYGVICNPHIVKCDIDFDDKFIIIASDGVWDALNENDILQLSQKCKNSKDLCDMIVKYSLGKSMDNISCFVIRLN